MRFVHSAIDLILTVLRRILSEEEMIEIFSSLNGLVAYSSRSKRLRNNIVDLKKKYKVQMLICDSGAYTLHSKIQEFNHKSQKFIISYVENYAKFINETKNYVDYYIEVDYPEVFGYEFQRWQRKAISQLISRDKFMPVFHGSEDDDIFYELVEEYPYIAIQDIRDFEHNYERFIRLCNYAIKRNIKIHALTAKDYKLLKLINFYSMDCAAVMNKVVLGSIPIYDVATMSFKKIPENIEEIENFDFGKYKIDKTLVGFLKRYILSKKRKRTIYEDYPVFCKFLFKQYQMLEEDITRLWQEKYNNSKLK